MNETKEEVVRPEGFRSVRPFTIGIIRQMDGGQWEDSHDIPGSATSYLQRSKELLHNRAICSAVRVEKACERVNAVCSMYMHKSMLGELGKEVVVVG